ncbi:MAG TPA: DNA translocase FtsK, partial [Candidatus Elarobacter sp.]|nr:DNA translocase FtsK [Candidatus Elarobacter sp.]
MEIAGIAALGFALLLGIALVAPPARTGAVGGATAFALHALFGLAAPFFVLLIALVAAIVFLEINVPRMIATLGGAACAYFVAIDAGIAASGRNGGLLGGGLATGLRALLGDAGLWIVLVVAVLAVTVAITGVSVKKVIGWCVARIAALRPPSRPAGTNAALAPARPASLREAFHLPALLPRAPQPAAAAAGANAAVAAPEIPVPTHTVVESEPVRFYDEELDDEDDDLLDEGEYDDDAYDEDEYEADDDADDAGDVSDEPDDDAPGDVESGVQDRAASAPLAVTGEVEAAPPRPAYVLPNVAEIFDPPQAQKIDDESRRHVLEDTLASFGVGAKVTHIERGPSITRYELRPDRGVKISRISSLADDLALALAATSVRIEAPIPGKSAVGIEIPNTTVSIVALREILDGIPRSVPPLTMALG